MADYSAGGIAVPHILIPDEKVNMRKWSVVACDQFTYDHNYWDGVDRFVGNAPSTLHMMLPEIYLGSDNVADRIEDTKDTMYDYIETGILKELPEGFMLVERFIKGRPRLGLMVLLDLEKYEFEPGMQPVIRPTEQTIKNRIPPRMQIRMGAPIEMPHILAIIDDPECTVIEPVYDVRNRFKKLYDFELMQNGGRISGYFVDDPECIEGVMSAMAALPEHDGMKIAIGDGNHSLATAKEVWNRAKQVLSEEEIAESPLRYALCELVNLNDPALDIQPIHRAVVGMNPSACIQYIVDKLNQKRLGARLIFSRRKHINSRVESMADNSRTIYFSSKESNGRIELTNLSNVMMLEDLQPVLEQLVAEVSSAKLEYIHGNAKISELAGNYDTLCFTLPSIKKDEFMDTIVRCGVLPKKCFSLGEENEKRYYLESRLLIIPEDDAPVEDAESEAEAAEEADIIDDSDVEEYADYDEVNDETAVMTEEFAEEISLPEFPEPEEIDEEELAVNASVLEEIDTDGDVFPQKPIKYRDDLDDFIDECEYADGSDPSGIIED